VSVNTVKTHLRGVYRKLGARSRRDAVTIARQRGIDVENG
jgi:LuxR family maltose regulon positive regulatory protein